MDGPLRDCCSSYFYIHHLNHHYDMPHSFVTSGANVLSTFQCNLGSLWNLIWGVELLAALPTQSIVVIIIIGPCLYNVFSKTHLRFFRPECPWPHSIFKLCYSEQNSHKKFAVWRVVSVAYDIRTLTFWMLVLSWNTFSYEHNLLSWYYDIKWVLHYWSFL